MEMFLKPAETEAQSNQYSTESQQQTTTTESTQSYRHRMIATRLDEFLASKTGQLSPEMIGRFDERAREQLVASLADGTVFSILESLKDLQAMQENEMWQQRNNEIEQLRLASIDGLVDRERVCEIDRRIMEKIDQIAHEQQGTLICAGLPLFKSSMEADELRLQMAIIQFIFTLGPVYDGGGVEQGAGGWGQ